MRVMDLTKAPLIGLNLVEASAGTGKTYTLTGLYLRLLIEQSLSPEQILVVTYTNAATSELKERIRQRLLSARSAFKGGETDDLLIQTLLARHADVERVVKQLNLAIAGFDQAAIYTIHGFCQRVLVENAFETKQPFDAELAPDQSAWMLQIADDFWRSRLESLTDSLTDQLLTRIGSPEQLLAGVRQGVGKPYLQVRGAVWPDDLEALDRQADNLIRQMRSLWSREGSEIREFLMDEERFKQTSYNSGKVTLWCVEMHAWLAEAHPLQVKFDNLKKFTPRVVESGLRKGQTILDFELFNICQEVKDLIESRLEKYEVAIQALRREFFDYLGEELPKRQHEAGEWSYDDLLLQLEKALCSGAGERLAGILRQRFPAALVDEFQDTDPVQYEILSRIYAQSGQPVFLVGDPKQAIYSFRGADIFAYLSARSATREQYSLEVNWRSTAELIRAFNTLFTLSHAAFYFEQIPYHPVKAPDNMASDNKLKGLHERGDKAGPLRIWHLPLDDSAKLPVVRQAVVDATADEITRLLTLAGRGGLKIAGSPLGGGDIAVLVRTHNQAEQVADALLIRGVHSVRSAQDNVFLSREAEQLERLLLALAEPRREPLMRAALTTDLLGWSGEQIDELSRNDTKLSRQQEQFLCFHQRWRDQGFMRLFRQLLINLDIERRLLAYRDGERRLTNLFQLGELLHHRDSELLPGMAGLLKWFSRQRQDVDAGDEERQLRLESDSDLVKIVTQHASKGLQYPVVFCPFLWDETLGLRRGQSAYLFHDPSASFESVFELGSPSFKRDQKHFTEEQLAENLRLLYVALTRARYRCYLPWGKVKNSGTSALAWLLHPAAVNEEDVLGQWQAGFKKLTVHDIRQRLEELAAASNGAICLTDLPAPSADAQLALQFPADLVTARSFSGVLEARRRISSFSSLISGHAADLPDYDALNVQTEALVQERQGMSIHGFPRGANPGTCLHEIFEHLDFSAIQRPELEQLVERTLHAYSIETGWTPVVSSMYEAVLATPLNGEGLKLGELMPHQHINEMEFHFPVRQLDFRQLEALLREHRFAHSERIMQSLSGLGFGVLQGFMKGFIDLVFESGGRYYLADYKSNWLGEDISAYSQPRLEEAMVTHHYPLQYLFYSLALHRYLRQRLAGYDYERHFGAVFYLFLRGIDPAAGYDYGVFQERPPVSFMHALDRLIEEGQR